MCLGIRPPFQCRSEKPRALPAGSCPCRLQDARASWAELVRSCSRPELSGPNLLGPSCPAFCPPSAHLTSGEETLAGARKEVPLMGPRETLQSPAVVFDSFRQLGLASDPCPMKQASQSCRFIGDRFSTVVLNPCGLQGAAGDPADCPCPARDRGEPLPTDQVDGQCSEGAGASKSLVPLIPSVGGSCTPPPGGAPAPFCRPPRA